MREHAQCGTLAAARRHYRHSEPLDYSCRQAMARDAADRGGRHPGDCAVHMADPRPVRNNIAFVPYAWRDPARMTPERRAELAALDELEALLDGLASYAQTITSDALQSEVTSDGPDPPRLRGLRRRSPASPDGSAVVAAA
jgi:hypothetical protein